MVTLNNVLVATDLGDSSKATVDYARSVASAFSAKLHVVHVADDLAARATAAPGLAMDLSRLQTELEDHARRQLDAIASDPSVDADVTTTVLTSHRPAAAILAYARDAFIDLIVAGAHAQHGVVDMFMGSVAQELVRRAPCPVLTLRHADDLGLRSPATA
jgi:nucleotide-binding universal stress UspA family protein